MSLAVGLVAEDGVYLGADSAAVSSEDGEIYELSFSKIFPLEIINGRKTEKMLVASLGSIHTANAIRHLFVPPQREEDDALEYLIKSFVPELREFLREEDCVLTNDSGQIEGGTFLIGYRGRLFEIQSDWSVLETKRGYTALGWGAGEARGVLWLTAGFKLDPRERVELALEAGAEHNAFLRGPFVVEFLPKGE